MKTKDGKFPPPTKGQKPNMVGVPGELVELGALDLCWGGNRKTSAYDVLLEELNTAKPGMVLKFGDTRAKASVWARAKKKGLSIQMAEHSGALFVRVNAEAEQLKQTRRDQIRKALGNDSAGLNAMMITRVLREKGDNTIDAELTGSILMQMMRTGEVIRAEGDLWKLGPEAPRSDKA